mmetsp:Transcript_13434/g.42547  ORF Transcript_13434/g.42547 Transcript_13434/m.42547 type:complete len:359 (+) Transcript_13434:81-1157(+)
MQRLLFTAVLGCLAGAGGAVEANGADEAGLMDMLDEHGARLNTSGATSQPPACPIDTPEKFLDEFDRLGQAPLGTQPIGCVSADLHGCLIAEGCGGTYLAHPDAQKAWVAGRVSLEMILSYQSKWGKDKPGKVTAATTAIMGPKTPSLSGALINRCLIVFKADDEPQVPAWTYWFRLMSSNTPPYSVSYPVQKSITIAYSQVSKKSQILDIFQTLTGCSASELKATGQYTNCNPSVAKIQQVLQPFEKKGIPCVHEFWDKAAAEGWSTDNEGDVRMMLNVCFEVTPWNTGSGLGWNTYANPTACKKENKMSASDKFTGEQYVIDNVQIAALPQAPPPKTITLTDSPADKNVKYAKQFC